MLGHVRSENLGKTNWNESAPAPLDLVTIYHRARWSYRKYYHVNDHLAQGLALFLVKTAENVAVWILKQLECHGEMVVLEHRLVVVHERQLGTLKQTKMGFRSRLLLSITVARRIASAITRIDEELVGKTRVIHVVYGSGENGGHYFQIGEHRLPSRNK